MTDGSVSPTRVLGDAARIVAGSISEFVPPEAQVHLLNAQRELLLAVAVIVEHNTGRTPRRPRGRRSATQPSARQRPARVEID